MICTFMYSSNNPANKTKSTTLNISSHPGGKNSKKGQNEKYLSKIQKKLREIFRFCSEENISRLIETFFDTIIFKNVFYN